MKLFSRVFALLALGSTLGAHAAYAAPSPICSDFEAGDLRSGTGLWGMDFDAELLFAAEEQTGFRPYVALEIPELYILKSAKLSETALRVFDAEAVAEGVYLNPLTDEQLTVEEGKRLVVIQPPIGQLTPDQEPLEIALRFGFNFDESPPVDAPLAEVTFGARCGFALGDSPQGSTPILQDTAAEATFEPALIEFIRRGQRVWVEGKVDQSYLGLEIRVAPGVQIEEGAVVAIETPRGFKIKEDSIDAEGLNVELTGEGVVFELPSLDNTGETDPLSFSAEIPGYFEIVESLEPVCGYDAEGQSHYAPGFVIDAGPLFVEASDHYAPQLVTEEGGDGYQYLREHSLRVWPAVINESFSPTSPYLPGDVFQMNLQLMVGNNFNLYDGTVTSELADGLRAVEPIEATLNLPGQDAVAVPVTAVIDSDGTQKLTFTLPDFIEGKPSGLIGSLSYDVEVLQQYTAATGDYIQVQAGDRLGTSHWLDTRFTETPDATCDGDFRIRESQSKHFSEVRIKSLEMTKLVYAVNGIRKDSLTEVELAPGDEVTFLLRAALPSGDVAYLDMIDFLPIPKFAAPLVEGQGLADFDTALDTCAGGSAICYGPNHSALLRHDAPEPKVFTDFNPVPDIGAFTESNALSWRWEGISHDPEVGSPGLVAEILVKLVVLPFPAADGSDYANVLNGGSPREKAMVFYNLKLQEPELQIAKYIVGASNTKASVPDAALALGQLDVDALPAARDAEKVDAGDILEYALVIANSGRGKAFNVRVQDEFSQDLSLVSAASVTAADGTPIATVGDLFTTDLVIPEIDAESYVLVRYDLKIGEVETNQILPNTARLGGAYSVDDATLTGLLADLENAYTEADFSVVKSGRDTAEVAAKVAPFIITKSLHSETLPIPFQAGDVATYTIAITVPEGTHSSVVFEDVLPSASQFQVLDILSFTLDDGITVENAIAPYGYPTPPPSSGANVWDLGEVRNTNTSDVEAKIHVVLRIRSTESLSQGNKSNRARLRTPNGTGGTETLTANASNIPARVPVAEPVCEAITFADAGDVLERTASFTVTGQTGALARETVFTVALEGGLTVIPATISDSDCLPLSDNTGFVCDFGTRAVGTHSVSYEIQVPLTHNGQTVGHGSELVATSAVAWKSQEGCDDGPAYADPTCLGHTARADSCPEIIKINSPVPEEKVADSSPLGEGKPFRLGDIVAYTIKVNLQPGLSTEFTVRDALPSGLTFESADGFAFEPAVVCQPDCAAPVFDEDETSWTWATIDNAGSLSSTLSFELKARVTGTGSKVNTLYVGDASLAAKAITARRPNLTQTVSLSEDLLEGDDTTSVTIKLTNSQAVPAYDNAVTVNFGAAGLVCPSEPPTLVGDGCGTLVPGSYDCDADGVATWTVTSIDANGTCSMVFEDTKTEATLLSQSGYELTTKVDYHSLPATDDEAAERKSYAVNGKVPFSSKKPTVEKQLVATSSTWTEGADLAHQEIATFALVVTFPVGVTESFVLEDTGTELVFVDAELDPAAGVSLGNNNATPAENAGALRWDFGDVTVSPGSTGVLTVNVEMRADFDPADRPAEPKNSVVALVRNDEPADSDEVPLSFVAPEPVLSLSAVKDAFVEGDEDVTLVAILVNDGDGPLCPSAEGTDLVLEMPSHFEALESEAGVFDGQTLTVGLGACLEPGERLEFEITGQAATTTSNQWVDASLTLGAYSAGVDADAELTPPAGVTQGLYVNAPPTADPIEVWTTTESAEARLEISEVFEDRDGDGISAPSSGLVDAIAPGITVTNAQDGSGDLVFQDSSDTPAPGVYEFDVSFCDDDSHVQACGTTTVTVVVNDPPSPAAYGTALYAGETAQRAWPVIAGSTDVGEVDGGLDAGSLAVSATAGGAASQGPVTTEQGGLCAVDADGVSYVAPDEVAVYTVDTCWVEVCETKPETAPRACGRVAYTFELYPPFSADGDRYATGRDEPKMIPVGSLIGELVSYDPDTLDFPSSTEEGGTISIEDGILTYTPPEGFSGEDSFTFEVCDLINASECEDVEISFNVNAPPEFEPTEVWISTQDTEVEVEIGPLYSDVDGDPLDVSSLTVDDVDSDGPVTPSASFDDDTLKVSFPDAPAPGEVTILYEGKDNDQGTPAYPLSGEGTVKIIVNDPPTLKEFDDAVPAFVDAPVSIPVMDIVVDLGLVEGKASESSDGIDRGTIAVSGDPNADPNDDAAWSNEATGDGASCAYDADTDSIVLVGEVEGSTVLCAVRICEEKPDHGVCSATVIEILVPTGEAVARDDAYQGLPNTTVVVSAEEGMLANDEVPVEGQARVADVTQPDASEGVVDWAPNGSFEFTPADDFVGVVTFEYVLSDGLGSSETATVTIVINDAPTSDDRSDRIAPGQSTTYNPVDDLGYDPGEYEGRDPDTGEGGLGSLKVSGSEDGPFGDESGLGIDGLCAVVDGEVVVTAPTASGTYYCYVEMCEAYPLNPPLCTVSEIEIYVPEVDTAGIDDHYVMAQGDTLVVDGPGILANDLLDDETGGQVVAVYNAPDADTEGELEWGADGSFTFTPVEGFAGTVVFTYELCDEIGRCDTAEVTIVVNDPPTADDVAIQSTPGTLHRFPVDGTGAIATPNEVRIDEDGSPYASVGVAGDPGGPFEDEVALGADGLCVAGVDGIEVVAPTAPGVYRCIYQVCETQPTEPYLCDTAEIVIVVADGEVVAQDDRYVTAEDEPITIDADEGLLANDRYDGSLDITVRVLEEPTEEEGELEVAEDGSFTFTPAEGFVGEVIVTYEVCDGAGQCDTAELTIIVNDPPVVADPELSGDPGDEVTVPFYDFVIGAGEVNLDPDEEGDGLVDEFGVAESEDGPFSDEALIGEDGACWVNEDASVGIRYPTEPGDYSCFVEVCEYEPEDLCSVAEILIHVVAPDEPEEPEVPEVPEDREAYTLTGHGGCHSGFGAEGWLFGVMLMGWLARRRRD